MSEHLNGEIEHLETAEESPQICNQCQTIPDQYISLKCSHNLCLPCLAQIYKDMREASPELEFQIICPFDQIETVLDEFSLAALQQTIEQVAPQEQVPDFHEEIQISEQENPLLNSQEDKLEEENIEHETRETKDQSEDYNEHRIKGRKEPKYEPKNNESTQTSECFRSCPKHRKETASIYCFSCQSELLCVQCLVDGFHDQHEIKNLRKNPEVMHQKFEVLMERMQTIKQNIFQWISEHSSKQKIIDHKIFETKTQIINDFKDLREKLNSKERELLQKTDEHSSEKLREIEEEIAVLKEKYQRIGFLADKNKFSLNQKDPSLEGIIKTYKTFKADLESIEMPIKPVEQINESEFKCYLNMDSFYKYLENIQILKLEITGLVPNKKKVVTPLNFPKATTKSYLLQNNNSFFEAHEMGGLMDFELNNEIKRRTSHEKNKFQGNFIDKKPYMYIKPGYDHINSQMTGKRSSVANRSTQSFLQAYGVADILKDVNRSSLSFMKKMKEASIKTRNEDKQFNRSRINTSTDKKRLMNSLEKQKSLFEKNKNVF